MDLFIVDDLALQAMDERETADLYEIVTSRHPTASMVVRSNRDPMHAQALVDRFVTVG